jgi:hypothetical protein
MDTALVEGVPARIPQKSNIGPRVEVTGEGKLDEYVFVDFRAISCSCCGKQRLMLMNDVSMTPSSQDEPNASR